MRRSLLNIQHLLHPPRSRVLDHTPSTGPGTAVCASGRSGVSHKSLVPHIPPRHRPRLALVLSVGAQEACLVDVRIEERCGIEHLLMGFKQPGEQYVIGEWIRDAMEAVSVQAHKPWTGSLIHSR